MLSPTQRTRIRDQLEEIVGLLSVDTLIRPERALIRNEDDYPVCQITFLSEGNRQIFWQDILSESSDPSTHYYQSFWGNISRATISVALEALDVDQLQTISNEFYHFLWNNQINTWNWGEDKLEFRSSEPPKFLPPYKDFTNRHDVYQCKIDFYVDYEFSWERIDAPILAIAHYVTVADKSISDKPFVMVAPGCYLMDGIIGGEPATKYYKMNVILSGFPAKNFYKMNGIVTY